MDYLIMFLVVIAGVIFFVVSRSSSKQNKTKELEVIEKFMMGKYLAGLPGDSKPTGNVNCAITKEYYIFLSGWGLELGKIPRDSINQIIFSDKSKISQRLTVTRILTLGVFSLAAPKKRKQKEFCVVIDWDSQSGKENTVFVFSGMMSENLASQATNKLNKYKKQKKYIVRPDEKKCPYCAEVIKKEAKICKFCHSSLTTIKKPSGSKSSLEKAKNVAQAQEKNSEVWVIEDPNQAKD